VLSSDKTPKRQICDIALNLQFILILFFTPDKVIIQPNRSIFSIPLDLKRMLVSINGSDLTFPVHVLVCRPPFIFSFKTLRVTARPSHMPDFPVVVAR
jgi:hypothetical protein